MHAYLVIGPTAARTSYYAGFATPRVECMTVSPEKSSITIAQIHALLDSLQIRARLPRVIVIDPADALTTPAANALLKTLEEPPAETTVYLGTSAPASVLPTIRSRCQIAHLAETTARAVETPYLPLIKSALQATPGDRIQLASSFPSDRQEALTAIYVLLTEIHETLHKTSQLPGRRMLTKIGTHAALAARRLEANCTVSLVIQEFLLSLPRTK
jgi:hypothetical protein